MSRTVHNPAALVQAEMDSVEAELAKLGREKRRTDRYKDLVGRREGLWFALAAFEDGCVQPECPHYPEVNE